MTSNVGARSVTKGGGGIGFAQQDETSQHENMRQRIIEEVKHTFNPEFLNRLDELVVFRQLDLKDMVKIEGRELKLSEAKPMEERPKRDFNRGGRGNFNRR